MRIERTGVTDLPSDPPSAVPPAARRVVVCDRDEVARGAVAAILTDEQFEIAGSLADDRHLADMVVERRPDVVVLAVAGSDGSDADALVATCALRIAPVVVLATEAAPALVARARDAGALAFLTKPPTRADLLPAVEVAIARYAEISHLVDEVAAISRRLESRKVIDRAKGLLMTHRRMSEPDAFRWIQRTAMDRRKPAQAIAAQVVAELGDGRRDRAAS